MFDVGFSEILLTSAIALVVLGPEKLPKVARQVGNWMGRARAMARQLTEQLEREVSADELMKQTKPKTQLPAPPISSAPAPFDTSYHPPPAQVAPPVAMSPAPAPGPGVYTQNPESAPIGADWQPAPPPEVRAPNE